jgi:hypothetical protein
VETGALAAGGLLLAWLNRGEHGLEPLPGALGSPAFSFVAAVAAVWLLPGFVLCRLAGAPWQGWPQAVALSLGAGLAWLFVPASVVLLTRARMDVLAGTVTALNGAIVLAYLVRKARRRGGRPQPADASLARPSPWLAAAAATALSALLFVSTRWPRFSYGSDEWILMRAVRYYLEAKPISYTWDFDVWDLVIALFIRMARVDLVDAYRVYLPVLLIVAASLAFFALAEALFKDRNAACLAYVVLVLFALSDMQTRGEGAGMGLVVRIMEDKYLALFVALPTAQAAFLAFLRGGPGALLAVAAVTAVMAVVAYPLALVWLAASVGAAYAVGLATRRIRARPQVLAVVAATLAAATSLAWWLRSLRAASYFRLYDPDWPFGSVLRAYTRRQLLILSPEDGWYMAHPALLRHPLTIAAVLSVLYWLPCVRRSLRAQFLVCATLVPLLLVYNPLTATILGGWITPWMVHRVLWALPVALALGGALHGALLGLQRRMAAGPAAPAPARGRYAALWLLVLVAMAGLLGPRMADSSRAMKARNRIGIPAGERELMHALSRDPQVAGHVLAPRGIGIRLPAWTSRIHPYPALDDLRWLDPERLREWHAFYEATAIGEAQVALLHERKIDYVITRTGSPLDQAMRGLPGPFRLAYGGASYSLYEWRPERWTRPPRPVTSFDSSGRNLAASSP